MQDGNSTSQHDCLHSLSTAHRLPTTVGCNIVRPRGFTTHAHKINNFAEQVYNKRLCENAPSVSSVQVSELEEPPTVNCDAV